MNKGSTYWKAFSACVCAAVLLFLPACAKSPSAEAPLTESDFHVAASLSTNTAHVGDVLALRLRIQHPTDTEIQIPSLVEADGPIVVRQERRFTRQLPANRTETDVMVELVAFELGRHQLTTNDIVFKRSDGSRVRHPMPSAGFEVVSILNDTNRFLQPARPMLNWPARVPRWVWVLPVVACLAALAGWLTQRFLATPRTILQMPPAEPPHEIALRALRALKNKGWIERENVEPFYVELSSIVRRYIEDRFGIRAPERTTEEFIREAAQSRDLSSMQQELVRSFLEQSDLVKFARFRPGRADMVAAFEAAARLIHETTPAPAMQEGQAS